CPGADRRGARRRRRSAATGRRRVGSWSHSALVSPKPPSSAMGPWAYAVPTAGSRAALRSRCDHESEPGFRPIVSGKGLPDVPAGELLILSRGLEQLVEADAAVVEGRQTTLPEVRRLQHLVEEVRHLLFGYGELVGRRPLLGEDGVHLLDRRRQRRCLPWVGRSDRRERSEPWIDEGRLGTGADAVDELLVLAEDLRHPSAEHA